MSNFQEAEPEELVSIYQKAHEELALLEVDAPLSYDQSEAAAERRAAIDRHRVMIRELRRALHAHR